MFGMSSSSCFSTGRINAWGHNELGNTRWLDESGQMSNQQKDCSVCMHKNPSSASSSSVREMARAAVHTTGNVKPPELRLSATKIDRIETQTYMHQLAMSVHHHTHTLTTIPPLHIRKACRCLNLKMKKRNKKKITHKGNPKGPKAQLYVTFSVTDFH